VSAFFAAKKSEQNRLVTAETSRNAGQSEGSRTTAVGAVKIRAARRLLGGSRSNEELPGAQRRR
jgi:hypothetical protein